MSTTRSALFALLAGLIFLPSAGLTQTSTLSDFESRFEFFRNGKLIGEARFVFQSENDTWRMESESKGTKGMARVLGFSESSVSTGHWVGEQPRPDQFNQEIQVAIKTLQTRVQFDWESNQAQSSFDDGKVTLALHEGVADPSTVGLIIRGGLARGEQEWTIPLVDEEEIEEQVFRAQPIKSLKTPIGCLQAIEVKRIRGPQSKRYTNTYYAKQHQYVPVFVEHGKSDGDHLESRLVGLVINGTGVELPATCSP